MSDRLRQSILNRVVDARRLPGGAADEHGFDAVETEDQAKERRARCAEYARIAMQEIEAGRPVKDLPKFRAPTLNDEHPKFRRWSVLSRRALCVALTPDEQTELQTLNAWKAAYDR